MNAQGVEDLVWLVGQKGIQWVLNWVGTSRRNCWDPQNTPECLYSAAFVKKDIFHNNVCLLLWGGGLVTTGNASWGEKDIKREWVSGDRAVPDSLPPVWV